MSAQARALKKRTARLARVAARVRGPAGEEMLSSGQVGVLLGVSSETVVRWANEGLLRFVRTAKGHRRFGAASVAAFKAEIAAIDKKAGA